MSGPYAVFYTQFSMQTLKGRTAEWYAEIPIFGAVRQRHVDSGLSIERNLRMVKEKAIPIQPKTFAVGTAPFVSQDSCIAKALLDHPLTTISLWSGNPHKRATVLKSDVHSGISKARHHPSHQRDFRRIYQLGDGFLKCVVR
jgi:hypothetical protein